VHSVTDGFVVPTWLNVPVDARQAKYVVVVPVAPALTATAATDSVTNTTTPTTNRLAVLLGFMNSSLLRRRDCRVVGQCHSRTLVCQLDDKIREGAGQR
jgi:hypothetical protein